MRLQENVSQISLRTLKIHETSNIWDLSSVLQRKNRQPESSQSQWFRVVLKQWSRDNVPTVPTMGSTPIFQPSPPGYNKPWISSHPKASGGFSHASRASMGIVFLPPQWPNQLWEHFLLLLRPFYSRPAQTLPGLNRGGTGEKRHMPSRPLHTHYKEKNLITQTCTHAHMHIWAHACTQHLT